MNKLDLWLVICPSVLTIDLVTGRASACKTCCINFHRFSLVDPALPGVTLEKLAG